MNKAEEIPDFINYIKLSCKFHTFSKQFFFSLQESFIFHLNPDFTFSSLIL